MQEQQASEEKSPHVTSNNEVNIDPARLEPAGISRAGYVPRSISFRNLSLSDLWYYRLPVAGIVSILHRISGAFLFVFGMPFLLYALQESFLSEKAFASYQLLAHSALVQGFLFLLIWAYMHHFCAGIRYLLLDFHIGLKKTHASLSSKVVLVTGFVLTVLFYKFLI